MNCETCDKALNTVKELHKHLRDVSDYLKCLQTESASTLQEIVEDRIIDLGLLQDTIVNEAIKAHMNRYLWVHSQIEKNPFMSKDDKANGWSELGSEIADLEYLFGIGDE